MRQGYLGCYRAARKGHLFLSCLHQENRAGKLCTQKYCLKRVNIQAWLSSPSYDFDCRQAGALRACEIDEVACSLAREKTLLLALFSACCCPSEESLCHWCWPTQRGPSLEGHASAEQSWVPCIPEAHQADCYVGTTRAKSASKASITIASWMQRAYSRIAYSLSEVRTKVHLFGCLQNFQYGP